MLWNQSDYLSQPITFLFTTAVPKLPIAYRIMKLLSFHYKKKVKSGSQNDVFKNNAIVKRYL